MGFVIPCMVMYALVGEVGSTRAFSKESVGSSLQLCGGFFFLKPVKCYLKQASLICAIMAASLLFFH